MPNWVRAATARALIGFHSANWRHDLELEGARVAYIGNAATAVQYVPEIAPVVDRLTIFHDRSDRLRFLQLLVSATERESWCCHAFCLMDTHVHLILEAALTQVSRGMHHVLGLYEKRRTAYLDPKSVERRIRTKARRDLRKIVGID